MSALNLVKQGGGVTGLWPTLSGSISEYSNAVKNRSQVTWLRKSAGSVYGQAVIKFAMSLSEDAGCSGFYYFLCFNIAK